MDVKPIPLGSSHETQSSDASGSSAMTHARQKAEREFQAMLLREMIRPLTEALFSGKGGFSSEGANPLGGGANDTYAYFLEGALSHQLSQRWPLPKAFGEPGEAPRADPLRGSIPVSLDRARDFVRSASSSVSKPQRGDTPAIPARKTSAPFGRRSDAVTAGATGRTHSGSDPLSRAPTLPEMQIRRAARLFELPENLVRAVVLTESGGRADAVSAKGAVGYMQVLPSTAEEMGVADVHDPWQNVYAGTKYLRRQLDRFGDLEHALAAYNAGPGAVSRHGGIPPYRETREYVQRVLDWKSRLDLQGS